jgi:hypothetical protein
MSTTEAVITSQVQEQIKIESSLQQPSDQSILSLSFDGSVSFKTIQERLEAFDITSEMVSYDEGNSKLFFLVNEETIKPEHFDLLKKASENLFFNCGLKHIEQDKLNNKAHQVNLTPIDSIVLVNSGMITMITRDGKQTRKVAEKKEELLDYYSSVLNSAKKKTSSSSILRVSDSGRPSQCRIDRFDFSLCAQKVKVFREFLDGMCLNHSLLWGLATNLIWIKGGVKLMKDTMIKYNTEGKTKYSQDNFSMISYVNMLKFLPQSPSDFSPYSEDIYTFDLLKTGRCNKGYINNTKKIPRLSIAEAEVKFKEEIERVISEPTKKIYIINVPTGLGKTSTVSSLEKVKIAFPTHKLKEEIFEKTGRKCGVVSSPELPEFSERIGKGIKRYYELGLHHLVQSELEKLAEYENEDGEKAKKYLLENRGSRMIENTVYTTHENAMLTECLQDTLIFDEDPIRSHVKIGHIVAGYLFNLTKYTDKIREFHDEVDALDDEKVHQTPKIDIAKDGLIKYIPKADVNTNIVGFLSSDYFIKQKQRIYYATVRKLPEDRKVIILSATPLADFYKEVYGDRVEVIEVGDVENQSPIVQYTGRSYTRSSTKNGDIVKLRKKHPDMHLITFKQFSEDSSVYYGNCSGYDDYKGQDLVVAGTPHINPFVYLLYAKVMGVYWTYQSMQNTRAKWRGYEFTMMCYDDPDLRNIQFSCIEAELIQAVGRARTIRTDAKVVVYANFPIRIADEFRPE